MFFAIVFGPGTPVRAQVFDSVLNVLDSRYPQERIYVHFDRSMYNPGETIWLKAYLFTANVPSNISKTLYAELLDEKGKLIERKLAPVVISSAAAAFDLPATLDSRVVYVRAYTDWMLNFDSSFIYQRPITVIQPEKSASVQAKIPASFLQFFPEGGDLVEGLESRVAFKATDGHGVPFDARGAISDSKGKEITKFVPAHDGMGYFTFTPQAGEQYKATWKDAAGKVQTTRLPSAKKEGYVFSVVQQPDELQFTISRKAPAGRPAETMYVVGQMQQQMVYMASTILTAEKTVTSKIPTTNIPAGIVQVTLFTKDHKPVAERIVFVNKQDYYFITDLNSALKNVEKRRKNVFQVDVPDTISTNLSVSVTDAGVNPHQKGEEDIFSGVLLTSDIKGYVHHPGYYFSSEADSVVAHLDLVMMTHGWRRFKWEDALAGKFPVIKNIPSDYITISGKVNGLMRTELVQKELTGILEANGKQQFLNIPVTTAGQFAVEGLLFFDTARLYYQFNQDKDKILTSRASFDIANNMLKGAIKMKSDTNGLWRVPQPLPDVMARNIDMSEKNLAVLDARRKVQTLESVTVTGRIKSKQELMDEQYTSGMFSGGDAQTFIMEDDIASQGALSVLNYLQGRVAGLQITGNGAQMSMSWRGGSPSLFLNEMQSDVSMIQNLSMADVAMVKVFRPPFMGAPGGGSGGAVAVYTKKGAAMNNENVKGLPFVKVPGYSPAREFYSPDYSKYDSRHTDADYRSTLYWNPFFLTDRDRRRLFITFHNNDVTRRFRIVIEGCNAEGKLTRIEKIFE